MHPNHLPAWLAVVIPVLVLIALWDAVWKAIGMWKSARKNQLAWFICILIFNTAGILPIVYILWCQKDCNHEVTGG
jgi:methionyl-tRNA synthetase